MQKILRRRIFRDLRSNAFRYLALALMIVLSMYLIVSLTGAAETVIQGVDKAGKEHHLEDGEFTLFMPLTEGQEQELTEAGVTLEAMFYMDFEGENQSTLRLFANRKKLNLLALDEGHMAKKDKEVVMEKRYCQEQKLKVGDSIQIGGQILQIVGIGSVPDYDAPYKELSESSVDSKNFGLAFVTEQRYASLKAEGKNIRSESITYAYVKNRKIANQEIKEILQSFDFSPEEIEDPFFQEYWDQNGGRKEEMQKGVRKLSSYLGEAADGAEELYDGTKELQEHTNELMNQYIDMDIDNLIQFLPAEDNHRIKASANDQIINKAAGLIAGLIVLVLFSYVISVFVIHSIEQESSVIGTLYAMGIRRKELIRHYLTLPVIITAIAGIIGTLIGFSRFGLEVQMRDCYEYFSVPVLTLVYPTYLVLYGILMPPAIALLVNYLVMNKSMKRPVLALINKKQKEKRARNLELGDMGFVGRFRIRQMLREIRSTGTIVFGMFISLLILLIGLNCYVMCMNISSNNKADTKYEYMYTYKYPPQKVPAGGESAYAVTLMKENLGYQIDVTLLGIHEDSPYFDAPVKAGESKVVLSSAAAQKFGLQEGDQLVLTDKENDRNYAFTIQAITQYSPAMYAFMDIDSMRELFGQEGAYFNVVFSKKSLDIPSGQLYAVNTKADVEKSSDVFISMMMPMIRMMGIVSVLVFGVVMYLMMMVMVDRSAFGISLMKVFGYREKEVKKLYLNGNFYVVAIGAAICLPLSKVVMDAMYPVMVANVACSMDMRFSWQLYLEIYIGMLLLYVVINALLSRRLKKVLPADVLKNRE